ncbi:hypothetical protein E3N88_19521 [Mikania micrantha]|uniref:OPA3-like protein n=1 Tax=Mikania micrantha TaxID=192012 RepID=A0A5N6NQU2_9ASTR|nr:hypothetical protein E3N88_19521 [Mikania micrantha]
MYDHANEQRKPWWHCLNTAKPANHRFNTKLQRRIYGHAIDAAIRPLNEEKAVQAAADFVGELFIFTVAGTALILEFQRSSKAEARKEARRKQELEALKQRDEDLAREIEMLKYKINEIEEVAKVVKGVVAHIDGGGGQLMW